MKQSITDMSFNQTYRWATDAGTRDRINAALYSHTWRGLESRGYLSAYGIVNYDFLLENFAEVVEESGGYDGHLILAERVTDSEALASLVSILDGLDDYPITDEEAYTMLEMAECEGYLRTCYESSVRTENHAGEFADFDAVIAFAGDWLWEHGGGHGFFEGSAGMESFCVPDADAVIDAAIAEGIGGFIPDED